MFRRRKVKPTIDPYIERRYEDIAACIHQDIENGRGRYSYYAPWLEKMLERLPSSEYRERYSVMPRQLLSAWPEEEEEEKGGGETSPESKASLHPGGPCREDFKNRSNERTAEHLPQKQSRQRQQAWSQGATTEEKEEKEKEKEEEEGDRYAAATGRTATAQAENVSSPPTRSRLCTIL